MHRRTALLIEQPLNLKSITDQVLLSETLPPL